jgi:hypothetical protein
MSSGLFLPKAFIRLRSEFNECIRVTGSHQINSVRMLKLKGFSVNRADTGPDLLVTTRWTIADEKTPSQKIINRRK